MILRAVFSAVLLCFLSCGYGQKKTYRCPPCASDCHKKTYNQPGSCSVCSMELILLKNSQFEGYEKEEISINNDSITLHAAYFSPIRADEIKAALVIVHGSAPSTYEDVGFYTKLGVELGMAVLAFDKRGVGKSEGTYENFSVSRSERWFDLMASDVLACVQWLKKRPELQQSKVGLLGGSQAGWIMPLAASKSRDIDFIISGEGVAVSAGMEDYFSKLTGDGDENGISISEAHQKLQNFKGEQGFDPQTILEELNTPTLWFLGTNDPVIPVDATLDALKRINKSNFTVKILQDGDHNFVNTRTLERYNLLSYVKPWLFEIGVFD